MYKSWQIVRPIHPISNPIWNNNFGGEELSARESAARGNQIIVPPQTFPKLCQFS